MRVLAKLIAPLRHPWRPLAACLLCTVVGMAQAQSGYAGDPPSRVARLSYIAGDLGFLPAGTKHWSDASINRPLTTGDRLSTGQDSRAELELGGGTLRMAGQTDFGVLDLSDRIAQVELTKGTLSLNVRRLGQGQSYEIDTPTVAMVVDQPGIFRIDVDDNGQSTRVTAFEGNATVFGENSAQRVIHPDRSYRFDDPSLASVAITEIGRGDAFDAWCSERDRRYARAPARRYVSDDVVGYQDLDQYGDWQTTSDYGAVWFPTHVAANWAPYRDGHWAYIAPWGWTWVDDSPWGFAPYHYGRWAYISGDWGWIPGPIAVRPIYAPALVAFVGGGGWSVGIGIGGGPVGWFPLGPGEIYNPWYRSSRAYYTRVNVTNIQVTHITNNTTIINNIDHQYGDYHNNLPVRGERYVNRDAPRGFTAMPGKAFASGGPVRRDLLHVDQQQIAAAKVLPRGANLRPDASALARPRSPNVPALPDGAFQREVVARHAPPRELAQPPFGHGPTHTLAGPQHAITPLTKVRMLNPGDVTPRAGSNVGPDQARTEPVDRARDMPGQPEPFGTHVSPLHNLPPTSNVAADAPIVMRRGDAAQLRPGELPSARFAHPQSRVMPGRDNPEAARTAPTLAPQNAREPQSQPGMRSIYGAGENPPSTAYRGTQTLPPVPQIQRATPIDQALPPADQRNPRFEPASQAPRADMREPPRAMPQPVRPHYAPAPQQDQPAPQRYQPVQRAMPPYVPQQARPEMARPQPHAVAPRAAPEPREKPPKKDDQQH